MHAWSRPPEVLEKEQLPGNNQAVTTTFLPWDSGEEGCGDKPVHVLRRAGRIAPWFCHTAVPVRQYQAGWQSATFIITCLPSLPLPSSSAGVVDVKEESLIAKQRVRVIKFQQVDALARVFVSACLHLPMAVPPVHRHDLTIAVPQIAFGTPFHITYRGQPWMGEGTQVSRSEPLHNPEKDQQNQNATQTCSHMEA